VKEEEKKRKEKQAGTISESANREIGSDVKFHLVNRGMNYE